MCNKNINNIFIYEIIILYYHLINQTEKPI